MEPQGELERAIDALRKLPSNDQALVSTIIREMAERAGIPIADAARAEVKPPIEYLDQWRTKLRAERYSPRTIESYEWAITHLLRDTPVPTAQAIRQYLAQRLAAGISDAHVNQERKAFKSFFTFLHEEGLWPNNPMAGVKPIPVKRHQPALPPEEDICKLLNAEFYRAEDQARFRLMMAILLDTGLRITEATTIWKTKIDFNRPAITVVGKGEKERTVPISITTAAMISEYLAAYDRPDNPYLFPGKTKGGCWASTNVERVMTRTCKRLGIQHIHPHMLRHYYATEMLRSGGKLEVVSRILGHSSIAITGDLYRTVEADEIDDTQRKHSPLNGLNGES